MTLRASDIIPISEARARLTELAEDLVGSGAKKVLTKNGSSYVALVDAKKLDDDHALELEHAGLILLTAAQAARGQVIAGKRMSSAELDKLLADWCWGQTKGGSATRSALPLTSLAAWWQCMPLWWSMTPPAHQHGWPSSNMICAT